MKSLLIAVLALALNASAGVVTVERINETIQRESGWNPRAVGRNKEIGLGQLKPGVVQDLREHFGWDVTAKDRWCPRLNRIMTEGYLVLIERKLKERLMRDPTWAEVSACYQLGIEGYFRNVRQGLAGAAGRSVARRREGT